MSEPQLWTFEEHFGELTFTATEAAAYARQKIAYCDRMTTLYPGAEMAALREVSANFLHAATRDPLKIDDIVEIHRQLRERIGREGSGWLSLLRYVEGFLQSRSETR